MRRNDARGDRSDASAALAQYRRRAWRYDLELAPFEPLRREAIALLELQPGDTVIDVGCGTGLSFAGLKRAVGEQGHVVGIDPSPDMLALARLRIARHGFRGITLLEASAAGAPLHGRADAALFHFTHDVLRDEPSLEHVFAHLKPGGRVAATGLQWAPAWLPLTNLFVWGAALYSVTRLEGLDQPWDLLARRLQDFQVRPRSWAGLYVAAGRVPG